MHPVLFTIPTPWGQQYIYSYGVMLGLSLIVGWHIVMALGSQRDGLSRDVMGNTYLTAAVSSIVGARLLYVLTNLETFESPAEWFDVRSGGLVAYGGFLGGFIGGAIYMRMKRTSLAAFVDAAAPALATGTLFTRLGCYLYGCDFGARLPEDAAAWLKELGTFPRWQFGDSLLGSPAFHHHVNVYGLLNDADHAYPVHPTQLYEAAAGLALLALCALVWRYRSFRGQVFLSFVMGYAIWRFFIEYLRDDPERGAAFGFSTSQLISLALVPLAATAYTLMRKQTLATPGPREQPAEEQPTRSEYRGKTVKKKPKKKR